MAIGIASHDQRSDGPPLSRRKRIVFRLLTLAIVYLFAETCAWLAVIVEEGSADVVRWDLISTASSDADYGEVYPRSEVVHPYLGYVMHVNNTNYDVQGARPFSITDYGFYDASSPIRHRSDDRVIVGITGGSVAHHFSVLSSNELAAVLAQRFPDRQIEFVRLALPGFKQPQQLMALNYVLALGGEFDVIINIDGFNEVALPGAENVANGVFSAFPRSWHLRMVAGNDTQALRIIGLITQLRAQKQEFAMRCSTWRWSPLALLIWSLGDSKFDRRILHAQHELEAMEDLQRRFCSRGPTETFESGEEMYSRLAKIWADSSLQMHRLCNANGIEYYHFLQPSPDYRPAASDDSRGVASVGGPPKAREAVPARVRHGYPCLLAESRVLTECGVQFFDVTDVFDDFEGSVYVDPIHFNKLANDHFAERIGGLIVAAAQRGTDSPGHQASHAD